MLETPYLYLALLILSLLYPVAQSFEHRLQYYKKFKFLWPGILLMMLVFIPWDVAFTHEGVWWFNDRYLTGIRLFLLPIEEWMFFIVVPFACVFLYEVLNYFIKKDLLYAVSNWIYGALVVLLVSLAIWHFGKLYTTITFLATAIALIILIISNPSWKGRFLLMYIVSWLPFVLINGALTGNFTTEAVVNYNPEEFMGFRITSIPVEDSVYSLLMLLMVVGVYEYLQKKNRAKLSQAATK
jgi:lycopene cyclase domain-containing protein